MGIPWEKLFNLPVIIFIYIIGGMTMSYIYKITNIITNKIYIGYTSQKNINRRFYQHKYEAFNTDEESNHSYLYQSMRKYGTENFIIEIVYEFDQILQNWEELEKYYIKKYNSIRPNGYNILQGGNKPPTKYGNENNKTKIKDEELPLLYQMLKNPKNSYSQIAKKFNISVSQLYNINKGKSRYSSNINYPIRKYSQQEEYALTVINILANDKTLSNKKIADLIPNYFRANEIASINNGKKYAYLWNGDFPIRKQRVLNNYEEKQYNAIQILKCIKKHNYKISQSQLQRETGFNRMIVEKTIKGIYPYNFSNISYPIRLNN